MKRALLIVAALVTVIAVSAGMAWALVAPAAASAKSSWRICGQAANGVSIVANANTSCEFARKVSRASRFELGYPKKTVGVISRATGQRITMRRYGCGCSSYQPYGYRGGNHAAVEFRS